jgi:hypothetical protein
MTQAAKLQTAMEDAKKAGAGVVVKKGKGKGPAASGVKKLGRTSNYPSSYRLFIDLIALPQSARLPLLHEAYSEKLTTQQFRFP